MRSQSMTSIIYTHARARAHAHVRSVGQVKDMWGTGKYENMRGEYTRTQIGKGGRVVKAGQRGTKAHTDGDK